ncbi:nematode cuticle collagen domain protein [Ancylostoma duodenale]|uniref:Nematode cuticle collagen domain protein n=1 Tax=Ancylostoma duodenale TaxID=51022 RepID=A0A0C2BJY0_9BILA|nr:nematode cuticle collagen domain protein [Ancylostoma duodenale]
MSRFVIGFTSAISGLFIFAAIVSVGYIFNDINSFYDDAMEDMKEFKVSLTLKRRFSPFSPNFKNLGVC